MDKIKQLKQKLKEVVKTNPNLPISGVVKSVEGDTCTVEIEGGLSLPDIRLKATADGSDHFLIVPKKESHVLMLSTDGTVGNMTVIKVDQASKIIFNENGLEVEIDSEAGKVQIKNNSVSLKELFEQSADIKKSMKVFTNMGPSGTPLPDVLAKITEFEMKFKSLLK